MELFIWLLCFLLQTSATKIIVKFKECDFNHICTNGFCKECHNCELLLTEGSACAENYDKCGKCMKGFKNELITHGTSANKFCLPNEFQNKTSKCLSDKMCSSGTYWFGGSCFNCSLLIRLSQNKEYPSDLTECDSCLRGFAEVTTKTFRRHCEEEFKQQTTTTKVNFFIFSVACIMLIIFSIVFLNIIKDCKPSFLELKYAFQLLPTTADHDILENDQFEQNRAIDFDTFSLTASNDLLGNDGMEESREQMRRSGSDSHDDNNSFMNAPNDTEDVFLFNDHEMREAINLAEYYEKVWQPATNLMRQPFRIRKYTC